MQSPNENQTQADQIRKGPTASYLSQRADNSKMPNCDLFKGYNFKVPNAIGLDNKLGKNVMPFNNLSKFADNPMKCIQVREQTTVKCQTKFKGHNSKVVNAIWLDIKLDQDCMPVNNLGKFGEDPMKNVQVRERTKVKCVIRTKSWAITQM